MRQSRTTYEDELDLILVLQQQVKRALQKMAFDIREGTADEQLLFDAIFSNQTRFGLEEATLLAFSFSSQLQNTRDEATDNHVQTATNAIKDLLIDRQKNTTRPVIGLGVY